MNYWAQSIMFIPQVPVSLKIQLNQPEIGIQTGEYKTHKDASASLTGARKQTKGDVSQ